MTVKPRGTRVVHSCSPTAHRTNHARTWCTARPAGARHAGQLRLPRRRPWRGPPAVSNSPLAQHSKGGTPLTSYPSPKAQQATCLGVCSYASPGMEACQAASASGAKAARMTSCHWTRNVQRPCPARHRWLSGTMYITPRVAVHLMPAQSLFCLIIRASRAQRHHQRIVSLCLRTALMTKS